MPSWLLVVAAIAGVLVAGFLRDRWRLSALERWCAGRELRFHSPYVPSEEPPVRQLVATLNDRDARLWGAGVSGSVSGTEVAIV